jgi:hypothetical protein
MLELHLQSAGYRVMTTSSGEEAREAPTRDLPILLITGKELSATDRQRLNGDVVAILEKASLDVDVLPREIERVVRKRS